VAVGKQGTWSQALFSLFLPVLIVFTIRWILIEPYIIPSGSMIPSLLIHDHIFVNKLSYGIRVPFTEKWLLNWSNPDRGEVIVFKFPQNPDVFYVKRVIGLPGETFEIKKGQVFINNQPILAEKINSEEMFQLKKMMPAFEETQGEFDYFKEQGHWIRFFKDQIEQSEYGPLKIPQNSFLVLGDNRDQSSDSRVWGFVPFELVLGKAARIWLGCENMLVTAPFICDPAQITWQRIFMKVQ
jgi:signal peptidase I